MTKNINKTINKYIKLTKNKSRTNTQSKKHTKTKTKTTTKLKSKKNITKKNKNIIKNNKNSVFWNENNNIIKIISKLNKNLHICYHNEYVPPTEFIKYVDIENYKKCKVFYNKNDNLEDVKNLVREREPVNICMIRSYYKDKLNDFFNFKTGAYGKIYKKYKIFNKLPPNIIIYTPAKLTKLNKNNNTIHILNVIGLSFDNELQPDYKFFSNFSLNKSINEAIKFYTLLFENIFKIAKYLNMKNIIMSLVGANNYAYNWLYWQRNYKYTGINNFQKYVWIPAWEKALQSKTQNIKIYTMGRGIYGHCAKYFTNNNIDDLGFFPELIKNDKIYNNLNKTLFINSWDCWSVPGNGNKRDNSLDGFMGRNTDIGFKGNSMTNLYLKENNNYISLN